MENQKFCLTWKDYNTNFCKEFGEFRKHEDFFDVTLACGGRVFETHKIMLCVCSAFFRQVLTGRQSNKHPIVFLKDIRPKHLEQLLQYMYNGEINVLQVREVSCSVQCIYLRGDHGQILNSLHYFLWKRSLTTCCVIK